MKKVIKQTSKHCLISATILAAVFAYLSNLAFNTAGGVFFNTESVNITNNVIDSLQLALYIGLKLNRSKSLNRFDLPFIVGGLVAIFA